MVEKLSSAEFEAFWGHDFNDNCRVLPFPNGSTSNQELFRLRGGKSVVIKPSGMQSDLLAWQDRERGRAVTRLNEFLDSTEQSEPIDVFKKGHNFKLADWPKGTMLRYNVDRAGRDSEVRNESHLGVIGQAKTIVGGFADILIVMSSEAVAGPSFMVPLVRLDPAAAFRMQGTVLGEVTHIRYSGQGSQRDILLRYNSIEVWKLGTAVREQVRTAGFKPKKAR